jgi:hypothetical protein
MVAAAELSLTELIDDRPDTFQVHSDAYMDAEVLDAEMRRIFERTRVYVGHESQVRPSATWPAGVRTRRRST